ncbi:hypothetical protein CDD81_6069 [Ophiocordyceps australis]|uniref:Haloacid dehalogenase, type II n=1 Tax=Ophiocordyceps australis TaxID=1399860 RepID=A0A2C5Y7Z4_9HYPO|nr:hypothetical protein CDD81_6069 [Ophiocordyceps australis]
MASSRPITSYSCLTFDCYGTLVDWEQGIWQALAPLRSQLDASHPLANNRPATLKRVIETEDAVRQSQPQALYRTILAQTYTRLAQHLGLSASPQQAQAFANSVSDWPVYPDTVDALQRLKRHFKLVILSNIDADSFQRTLHRQLVGVDFDAVYTAQDIGSYKPSLQNFAYLVEHCLRDLGVQKSDIVHTAYALKHDLVPAHQMGLASAWVDRKHADSVMGGHLDDYKQQVGFSWHYGTMGEMADAVDALAAQSKQ